MFNFLKKHLKRSVETLAKKVSEKPLTEKDIDDFFAENETQLLQSDVALDVIDSIRQGVKDSLVGKPFKRIGTREMIMEQFRKILYSIVALPDIDIIEKIRERNGQGLPAVFVFIGFNGSGKTTSIAKIAYYLKQHGMRPVIAAADTFRAASIEQLEYHGQKLEVKVVKHNYGGDAAAVIFDAVEHAKSKGCNVVLADTAGRAHTNSNLMDEIRKISRVNRPDLKVLVVDSLTGNDAVEQARTFNEAVGIDCMVLTKADVNEKGGSILSVCHTLKKPILFLGTGQGYEDMERFEPLRFVKNLLE